MSELPADPPIPDELLAAVLRVEDERLREGLETHLVKLPQSMEMKNAPDEFESWMRGNPD